MSEFQCEIEELLDLARISPKLVYQASLADTFAHYSGCLHDLIHSYFHAAPREYFGELNSFESVNSARSNNLHTPGTLVIIPAFNEERNFDAFLGQFERQLDENDNPLPKSSYELVFLLNCPDNPQHIERLRRGISILLEHRHSQWPNIHIVPKIFKPEEACLGRARKYAIDYCLLRLLRCDEEQIAHSLIACCEGDTRAVPTHYISAYRKRFRDGRMKLVQGLIRYPDELNVRYEPFFQFVSCRESLLEGQGLNHQAFPHFNGIMPVGRNMAFSPELYLRTAGIDPIRRSDTDDDMNWGVDINRVIGSHVKIMSDVQAITSPRREITILADICTGHENSLRLSYEKFHDDQKLYDLSRETLDQMAERFIPHRAERALTCRILSQMYQWVVSSCLKEDLWYTPGVDTIIQSYERHEIGYWEKERRLWKLFEQRLGIQPGSARVVSQRENKIADTALRWFNTFNRDLGIVFQRSDAGLGSVLQ